MVKANDFILVINIKFILCSFKVYNFVNTKYRKFPNFWQNVIYFDFHGISSVGLAC